MSDLETLEEIASDIDSEGWSDYADDIRGAAEEIQQLRDAIDEAMAAADRSCDPDCCYVSEILTKALQEQGND
jgi:hypothetical protein